MSDFISFVLDEFMNNIDTDTYYNKYENMDKETLYYYLKGKYEGKKEKIYNENKILEEN